MDSNFPFQMLRKSLHSSKMLNLEENRTLEDSNLQICINWGMKQKGQQKHPRHTRDSRIRSAAQEPRGVLT